MKHSHFQEAIFTWVKDGQGNAVAEAVAGSGKTTTLVELLRLIDGSVKLLAFNKSIADELATKVPMMVSVSTTNSFGNSIFRSHVRGAKFDKFKSWNIIKLILGKHGQAGTFKSCRNQITSVIGLYKASYDGERFADPMELIERHGIVLPNKLNHKETIVKACCHEAINQQNIIDFDDQIFMPVYMNMEIPTFDWVCIDEAQDMNPVQQVLLSRMLKPTGRLIAVGDRGQSIYGFRGADVNSIPNLIKRFSATSLPLSICYRCPKKIVLEAQKIVPQIECSDTAEDGEIHEVRVKEWEPKDGVFVLCRTTAPLVGECLRLIRKGRKAVVKGRDIGEALVTSFGNTGVDPNASPEGMLTGLEQYRVLQLARLKDRPEATKVILNDTIDTLVAIVEFIQEEFNEKEIKLTIEEMIEKLFSDSSTTGVTFSTIHRSKGEEYDHVHILRPDLLPHPKCLDAWQIQQEMNLKYVAITRAKKTLTWVSGQRHE